MLAGLVLLAVIPCLHGFGVACFLKQRKVDTQAEGVESRCGAVV
jgi:hypothetical protein